MKFRRVGIKNNNKSIETSKTISRLQRLVQNRLIPLDNFRVSLNNIGLSEQIIKLLLNLDVTQRVNYILDKLADHYSETGIFKSLLETYDRKLVTYLFRVIGTIPIEAQPKIIYRNILCDEQSLATASFPARNDGPSAKHFDVSAPWLLPAGVPIQFGDRHAVRLCSATASPTILGVLEGQILENVCKSQLDVAVEYLHFLQQHFYPKIQQFLLQDCWHYLFAFELQTRKPRDSFLKAGEPIKGLYLIYSGEISVYEDSVATTANESTENVFVTQEPSQAKPGANFYSKRPQSSSPFFGSKPASALKNRSKPIHLSKLIGKGESIGLKEITKYLRKGATELMVSDCTFQTHSNVQLLFCPLQYIRNFFLKQNKLWFHFEQKLEKLKGLQSDVKKPASIATTSHLNGFSKSISNSLVASPRAIDNRKAPNYNNFLNGPVSQFRLDKKTTMMHNSLSLKPKLNKRPSSSIQNTKKSASARNPIPKQAESSEIEGDMEAEVPAISQFLKSCRNSRSSSIKNYRKQFKYELKERGLNYFPKKTDLIYDNAELQKCRSSVSLQVGGKAVASPHNSSIQQTSTMAMHKDFQRKRFCDAVKKQVKLAKRSAPKFVF